jgi:short-subunit dehydrogenase
VSSLAVVGIAGGAFGGYWLVRYLRPRYSPLVLNGAVVVITGASAGIGRAYAEAFGRRGAKVVLVARRAALLDEVRREIEPYASEVMVIAADLTNEAERASVIAAVLDHFGRINILINNAGVVVTGPLETYDADAVDNVITVNLLAAIALTRLALPAMVLRKRGIIVNVASIAGRIASPGYSVYNASKSGLLGFSDTLRRDLHGTGVEVLSVLPGYTQTDMVPDALVRHLQQSGVSIFNAADVAEATIKAILNGENEVFIAGPILRLLAYMDRRYPNLTSVIFQAINTPRHIEAIRKQSQ